MKQIEPGCLAIIINSDAGNNGKEVICLQFLGSVPRYSYEKDIWLLDRCLPTNFRGERREEDAYCSERQLMRIDGHKVLAKEKAEVMV